MTPDMTDTNDVPLAANALSSSAMFAKEPALATDIATVPLVSENTTSTSEAMATWKKRQY